MTFLADPLWSPGRSGKDWVSISTAGAGVAETMKDGGLHGGNVLAVKDLIAAIEEDRQPECSAYEALDDRNDRRRLRFAHGWRPREVAAGESAKSARLVAAHSRE